MLSASVPRRVGWIAIALILLSVGTASAQTRIITILNADDGETVSDSLTGEVTRLIGNVRLQSDTTLLRANRATITDNRRRALMEGRVRILSGTDTLTADRVSYDATTRIAEATGNVRIGSEDGVLFAPMVTYNARDKRAQFSGDGRLLQDGAELLAPSGTYETERRFAEVDGPLTLRDSASTLTAARGTYDARSRRADVVGTVRLLRDPDRLDADSLVYFRRTERARAFGRVVLDRVGEGADSLRRGLLFGSRLVYDGQNETASMTADSLFALAVFLDRDSTGRVDSTFVRALAFNASREDRGGIRTEVLTAVGTTRLWRDALSAVADSAAFVRTTLPDSLSDAPPRDRLDLFGGALGLDRPAVWASGSQIVGDTLQIQSGALRDSVFATSRAFAAQLDSTLGRVQQLAGERMLGIVVDDALRRLHVWPAAQALAYQATADGLLESAIRVGADSLVFRFDADGEIRETVFFGDEGTVDGERIPGALVRDERLPGFAFDPDRRPVREDLLSGWEAAWLAANPDWQRTLEAPEPPDPARLGTEAEEAGAVESE
ncbi:MAG: OstA-like protein [Bacteroidota bacterium]